MEALVPVDEEIQRLLRALWLMRALREGESSDHLTPFGSGSEPRGSGSVSSEEPSENLPPWGALSVPVPGNRVVVHDGLRDRESHRFWATIVL